MRQATRLSEIHFVAFDTETTGFDYAPGKGSVVEIGATHFMLDGTELGQFSTIVNPAMEMDPNVIAIHGITNERAAMGRSRLAALEAFLTFLPPWMDTILVAHNALFDVQFIGAIMQEFGYPSVSHIVMDTKTMAQRHLPRLYNHKLGTVAAHYGVGQADAHRALADAITCREIFLAMMRQHGPDVMLLDVPGSLPLYKFSAPHRVTLGGRFDEAQ
jgi:DNA polymerase-3 subunit epsilon